jgi:hypothetical protein
MSPAAQPAAPDRSHTRGLVPSVVACPWLWVSAVLCMVASPALFLSTLVVGAVLTLIGIVAWIRGRHVVPLAIGLGMASGSLPYSLAALQAALRAS